MKSIYLTQRVFSQLKKKKKQWRNSEKRKKNRRNVVSILSLNSLYSKVSGYYVIMKSTEVKIENFLTLFKQ